MNKGIERAKRCRVVGIIAAILAIGIFVTVAAFRNEVVARFECHVLRPGNSESFVDFILTKYSFYKKSVLSAADMAEISKRQNKMRERVLEKDLIRFDAAVSIFNELLSKDRVYLYMFSKKSRRLQTNYYVSYDASGRLQKSYHGTLGLADELSCQVEGKK